MFGGWLNPAVRAETLARQRNEAGQLVGEALTHEVYGRGVERQPLLVRAVELCPDQPAGLWLQGQVRVENRWLNVTDTIETDRQPLRHGKAARRPNVPVSRCKTLRPSMFRSSIAVVTPEP